MTPDTSTSPLSREEGQSGVSLDVGERRIGVAVARLDIRIARPLTTLEDPARFKEDIAALCSRETAAWVVIGLPRGLDGQETAQTATVRAFGDELTKYLHSEGLQLPVYWIDEALTSAKAEQELQERGKLYDKVDIDALAATYILEDFLHG